jgi:hypothetical protein
MVFPLLLFVYRNINNQGKIIAAYCLISFALWLVTPQTGGGRFIMVYLPVFSLLAALIISTLEYRMLKKYLLLIVFIISIISISYRIVSNAKFVPVILGYESKDAFLSRNLNFSFGDFYDVDGFFQNNIKSTDKVLIYGIHNLFYVDFPFVHESWYKPDDKINFILVRGQVPNRFKQSRIIYENDVSNVSLYKIK